MSSSDSDTSEDEIPLLERFAAPQEPISQPPSPELAPKEEVPAPRGKKRPAPELSESKPKKRAKLEAKSPVMKEETVADNEETPVATLETKKDESVKKEEAVKEEAVTKKETAMKSEEGEGEKKKHKHKHRKHKHKHKHRHKHKHKRKHRSSSSKHRHKKKRKVEEEEEEVEVIEEIVEEEEEEVEMEVEEEEEEEIEPEEEEPTHRGGNGKTVLFFHNKTPVYDPEDYEVIDELKPMKPDKGSMKWWNRLDELTTSSKRGGKKWDTFRHNGIMFSPPYEPHGVKMLYDGKEVDLTPEQEEAMTFFAVMIETDHAKNPVFVKNFFEDWKKFLGPRHVIKKFKKCDFRPVFDHFVKKKEREKEERKNPEVKARLKAEKERLIDLYGYALVDGMLEKVGNFRVEPPGLFRGRGTHPKTGRIKTRVHPSQVILNIGHDEAIPKCPVPGANWRGVIHNNEVTWLAHWTENVNQDSKHVYLAASSRFKGHSDLDKYEKARNLKDRVESIREHYEKNLKSKDEIKKQMATALYLIDKLALRVGGEKDTKEVADTVGCCNLRVEHLVFEKPDSITLDFLGKDSMRYFNKVQVPKRVFKNMKAFCSNKEPEEQVFDLFNAQKLNQHLTSIMPGLTAKVFRTYNASYTLEHELYDSPIDESALESEKVLFYNRANREVAVLCNHQRSVPKGHAAQIEKMDERLEEMNKQRKELKGYLNFLQGKRSAPPASCEGKKRSKQPATIKAQLKRLELRIQNAENKKLIKSDTKTVSLGTSRINYMDPRITVAWCKNVEIPIGKIFNKTLMSKFPWAMEVESTWHF